MPCELLIKATDKPGGVFFKGDPIVVKDTPWVWGTKEGLPHWIILHITDASANQIEQYMESWKRIFTHEIINENVNGWRIRISLPSKVRQVFGIDKAFRTEMRDYLVDNYNAQVHEYDNVNHEYAEIDFPKPLIYIRTGEEVTLQYLKDDFYDKTGDALQPKQYYFSSPDVDAVVAAGGKINRTLAQVQSVVINRLTE